MAAYDAALEEYTRERTPLDWAMTQSNLGSALAALGEREAGRRGWSRRWPSFLRRPSKWPEWPDSIR